MSGTPAGTRTRVRTPTPTPTPTRTAARVQRPARLDPTGRLTRPRRSTVLRMALVAMLLLTAAGILYRGGDPAIDAEATADATADATAEAAGTRDTAAAGTGDTAAAGPVEAVPGDEVRQPIPDGMVGVPVPLGEPTALAVLRAGDRVDLLAVSATGGDPVLVADGATVLAVDRGSAAVLLALTESQAREVLSAPAGSRFAVVLRP